MPKSKAHSPHVLHNFKEVHVGAGLQWNGYQEGESHNADKDYNMLDEQTCRVGEGEQEIK